jgi:hypothetical protein
MEAVACSCKTEMVLLGGRLKNERIDEGQVWVCPRCDVPDKPASKGAKSIIELSEENNE